MSQPQTAALVLNPDSGSVDLGHDQLVNAIGEQSGLEILYAPASAMPLPDGAQAAAQAGADVVIVAGGDGTACCAADAIIRSDSSSALAPLPYGTANLLSKRLYGDRSVSEILTGLKSCSRARIPAGYVDEEIFLLAATFGFPTAFARAREAARNRVSGRRSVTDILRRLQAALQLMFKPRVRYSAGDGQDEWKRASGVVAWLGDAPIAQMDMAELDNELSCLALRTQDWGALLSVLQSAIFGALPQDRSADVFKAQRLQIKSRRPISLMLDGEPRFVDRQASVRVYPNALYVMRSES